MNTPKRQKLKESPATTPSTPRVWTPDRLIQKPRQSKSVIDSMCIKYGFSKTLDLVQAMQHVPRKFPNRGEYIKTICRDQFEMDEIVSCLKAEESIPASNLQLFPPTQTPLCVFLVPNISECICCGGNVYSTDSPTKVTLFTMNGAQAGLKCSLRCRECKTKYGLTTYHKPNETSKYLPLEVRSSIYEASNCVYFSKDLYEFLCESGNHGFVSAQAFAEIYNTVFGDEHPSSVTYKQWLQNSAVSGQPQTLLMTRKNTMEVFLNGELQDEVYARQMEDEVSFSTKSSRETIMQEIDRRRRTELYPHPPEDCCEFCQKRGCQNLRVIDGCWKLCIPHCMLAIETEVEGQPLLNFPNVCTEEPMSSSPFCKEHHNLLERNGIPTDKKDFLKHIGFRGVPNSQKDIKKVDQKVLELTKELLQSESNSIGTTATSYQGTDNLVRQMTATSLNSSESKTTCNKDTGEKGRLRQRARGHFAAVSGGGNILCFNPLYKSESPSQVFLLVIQMIYQEMKDVPEDQLDQKLREYILCYDNMCHLDSLRASKEVLPLPEHLKDLWSKIQKVIDRLHIKNHKDKQCLTKYAPTQISSNYNTMAGEQLFSWMSRFKKIVNSMTQTHHLFYLHRMCIRRNRYTTACHKRGIEPVFPGFKSQK